MFYFIKENMPYSYTYHVSATLFLFFCNIVTIIFSNTITLNVLRSPALNDV